MLGDRVRVFVSEYIAGGALAGSPLPGSMLREGHAMLVAVISDLLAIDGCWVVTTLDGRLANSSSLTSSSSLQIDFINQALDEQTAFLRECAQADTTLVIAPETGGQLRQRVEAVVELGRPTLNCSPEAIDLCGDKLRLAKHLIQRGIATIPTQAAPHEIPPWQIVGGDSVVKPRDGAGSWLTSLVPDRDDVAWQRVRSSFVAAGVFDQMIVQPRIIGMPLSVGCLCKSSGQIEIFPVANQHLTDDFQYQGGSLPVRLPPDAIRAIETCVEAACRSISGFRGYIGVDLILPDSFPAAPVIVEINPRLTTSYVGYRKLSRVNLANRMLRTIARFSSRTTNEPLNWNAGTVTFDAAGECHHSTT